MVVEGVLVLVGAARVMVIRGEAASVSRLEVARTFAEV
jgi:hypothetical protein